MVTLDKPLAKTHASTLEELYESCFPAVAAFVSKMQGSLKDAKDIFHDALVVFHEKTLDKDFKVRISNEA